MLWSVATLICFNILYVIKPASANFENLQPEEQLLKDSNIYNIHSLIHTTSLSGGEMELCLTGWGLTILLTAVNIYHINKTYFTFSLSVMASQKVTLLPYNWAASICRCAFISTPLPNRTLTAF